MVDAEVQLAPQIGGRPITLRPFSIAELQVIAEAGIPELLAVTLMEGALPPPFVAARSLRQLREGKAARWCSTFYIVSDTDQSVVGGCGFKDAPSNGRVEIGYGVSAACRNHGVATAAVRELIRLAFESEEVHEVLAQVSPTNVSSIRVLEKLNFEACGVKADEEDEVLVQWLVRKRHDALFESTASSTPVAAAQAERFVPLPMRLIILRFSGVLLVALGGLHLAVTPFIARMVQHAVSARAVGWLTPPMLLNHVVVGILLLPLGSLIFYAAPYAAAGHRWALIVSRAIAVAVATLPPVLFFLMGTRYFGAVPFRVAAGAVCVASLTLLIVAFWPVPAGLPTMQKDSAD